MLTRPKFGPDAEVIIPPPINATVGAYESRAAHVQTIQSKGRMTWQKETGYYRRAFVEAQIGRYKQVIGTALKSRKLDRQTAETDIACASLNRLTAFGRAAFQRVS